MASRKPQRIHNTKPLLYGEEDSEEWETEDEESDEPDADGGSTEEDDEDGVK